MERPVPKWPYQKPPGPWATPYSDQTGTIPVENGGGVGPMTSQRKRQTDRETSREREIKQMRPRDEKATQGKQRGVQHKDSGCLGERSSQQKLCPDQATRRWAGPSEVSPYWAPGGHREQRSRAMEKQLARADHKWIRRKAWKKDQKGGGTERARARGKHRHKRRKC